MPGQAYLKPTEELKNPWTSVRHAIQDSSPELVIEIDQKKNDKPKQRSSIIRITLNSTRCDYNGRRNADARGLYQDQGRVEGKSHGSIPERSAARKPEDLCEKVREFR